MKSLLFLSHRIPYPPDKGDKIRSYNVLRALSGRFRVHLGTFVDSPDDFVHIEHLRTLTCRIECRPLSPRMASVRSATGLLTGEALSLPYYRDRRLERWVSSTLESHPIDAAYVFSSAMGQYLVGRRVPLSVIDFCDVDSDKWAQYADLKPWPLSSVYRREARRLSDFERELAGTHDRSLFVSDAESRLFVTKHPEMAARVMTVRNGVDVEYFDPAASPRNGTSQHSTVVFTGAMDYWANIDAVSWFVSDVWPMILHRHRHARFLIVGARPTDAVKRLGRSDGVDVIGKVPDIRPFLARADVIVAPLRIARGVQNKVLEALAMARPIVATPAALTGLDSANVPGVRCARSDEEFGEAVIEILGRGIPAENPCGRQYVVENFGWPAVLEPLMSLLEQPVGRGVRQ